MIFILALALNKLSEWNQFEWASSLKTFKIAHLKSKQNQHFPSDHYLFIKYSVPFNWDWELAQLVNFGAYDIAKESLQILCCMGAFYK